MMNRQLRAAVLLCSITVLASRAASLQTPPAAQSPAGKAGPAPSAGAPPVQRPANRITEYTLTPELLQKAKTLGAIRFGFRVFSFFFSIFALWLILRMKWSTTFRDWAERATRFRFLQARPTAPVPRREIWC